MSDAVQERAEEVPLVEILDRLLDRGVVLAGGATISVAGVDLVELRLNLALASVDAFARIAAARASDRTELVFILQWKETRTSASSGRDYMEGLAARRRHAQSLVARLIGHLGIERALVREAIAPRDAIAATVAVLVTQEEEPVMRERAQQFAREADDVMVEVYGPLPPYSFVA